jgi:hypothetical protein
MVMQLDQVAPFGRCLDEYIRMFNLTEQDLQKSILSVADGLASFNAEGTQRGYRIRSIDPLYVFSSDQIRQRFDAVVDNIIEQVEKTPQSWVWTYHSSPNGLRQNRVKAMKLFCRDFELGRDAGRYEVGELPALKYKDGEFELGLCSHFLFLYSDLLDGDFHYRSLLEMLRVCREVRIFPLLTLMLQTSQHLPEVIEKLENDGYHCEIQPVAYELQRGGNKMLQITRGDRH